MEVVTKAVFRLWDIFGGTVNAKGYKVIFKDPKEGGFKKSQKGMCRVYRDERGLRLQGSAVRVRQRANRSE